MLIEKKCEKHVILMVIGTHTDYSFRGMWWVVQKIAFLPYFMQI